MDQEFQKFFAEGQPGMGSFDAYGDSNGYLVVGQHCRVVIPSDAAPTGPKVSGFINSFIAGEDKFLEVEVAVARKEHRWLIRVSQAHLYEASPMMVDRDIFLQF